MSLLEKQSIQLILPFPGGHHFIAVSTGGKVSFLSIAHANGGMLALLAFMHHYVARTNGLIGAVVVDHVLSAGHILPPDADAEGVR